jgi:Ca-activated chloride channel homolog
VAWTSDVKNRWGVDWIRWQGYPNFWAQVVRTSMRRKLYDSYDLTAHVDNDRGQVVVDAIDREEQFVNDLETTLEVIDPQSGDQLRAIPMHQSAPGRYEADFGFDHYGSYMLKAVHRRDGETVAESTGGIALPYPEEYLHSRPNDTPMRLASVLTGGLHEPEPREALSAMGEEIEYQRDLWPWFLFAVAWILILDLYLKRVRIFGYRTRSISLFGAAEGDRPRES